MLQKLFAMFGLAPRPDAAPADEDEIALISAALCIQLAGMDEGEDPEEINVLLEQIYGQSADHAYLSREEWLLRARDLASAATSLYEFTSVLNANCGSEDKLALVRVLWQVASIDGHIHHLEEHYIRRIADLLYIPHPEFVKARLQYAPLPRND